jgi:hypothetical protein
MIRAYNRPAPSVRRFITFNVRNYSSIVSLGGGGGGGTGTATRHLTSR